MAISNQSWNLDLEREAWSTYSTQIFQEDGRLSPVTKLLFSEYLQGLVSKAERGEWHRIIQKCLSIFERLWLLNSVILGSMGNGDWLCCPRVPCPLFSAFRNVKIELFEVWRIALSIGPWLSGGLCFIAMGWFYMLSSWIFPIFGSLFKSFPMIRLSSFGTRFHTGKAPVLSLNLPDSYMRST